MAYVEWWMRGVEFANCNCDFGCPCQFNSLPTHGNCCAHTFVHVEEGRFGDVSLDGLDWGILLSWPKAIHMGEGTSMVVIEERSNPLQRAALEAIAHGRETEPGTLVWQIFSTTMARTLPTLYKPISLAIDVDNRTARVRVPGLLESDAAPIQRGDAPHRVRLELPAGFEFKVAEFARGTTRAQSPLELSFADSHAHLARVHWSTRGVVA
ncbi:MAG TPA: DUF1326 domain-containing protein [Myxococcota bacterium]|nr:DUF1326 domain-containing protein [Myxococcota bacterium]